MKMAAHAQHRVIYRDEFSYCAHPHIVTLINGTWLMVFNRTVRRQNLLHPPQDPQYYNVITWSNDQGQTWSTPRVAPNYDWYGVECAGLTPLADGAILLNQWRFRWYPLEAARKLGADPTLVFPEQNVQSMVASSELDIGKPLPENLADLYPWARVNGGTYVHRSTDLGRTWDVTVAVNTSPYSGGYGMRGGVELGNGDVLMPFSDVPQYKTVFVTRSCDGGLSWGEPVVAAQEEDCWFEEPSALSLPDGRILMMLRENRTHFLYQIVSADGGWTWSQPRQIPIWGYPAHLLALPDGRILCVYGYRCEPYGIRAAVSADQGETWDADRVLVLRADLPNRDLGYPSAVLLDDREVFTAYYAQDRSGVTGIHGTTFSIAEID